MVAPVGPYLPSDWVGQEFAVFGPVVSARGSAGGRAPVRIDHGRNVVPLRAAFPPSPIGLSLPNCRRSRRTLEYV